jgi:hypothetical protein
MRHVQLGTLTLLAVLGTLHPPSVVGQLIDSPYRHVETTHSVSLYGGYLEIDPGRFDAAAVSTPLAGARYNIRLGGPASAELGLGFGSSERTIYEASLVNNEIVIEPQGVTDVRLILAEAGFRFNLTGPRTWNRLAPFLVGTVGLIADLAGLDTREPVLPEERFEFGPGFAAGIGLGSDIFLTERFSVRAEARDHLWRLTYPEVFTGTPDRTNEWVHNFGITLGGSIHF